jgi:hypothetical protein
MTASRPLTATQRQTLDFLAGHVGQTVDVLCGNLRHDMASVRFAGRSTHAALRGLEARGYIKASYYWRGATVTVLKAEA